MYLELSLARLVMLNKGSSKTQGFSMIEMLVALLVISVGLLGMAGLRAFSLRTNTSAYHSSQANMLAYDILDSMRNNRAPALEGKYAVSTAGLYSASERAKTDLDDWLARLQAVPGGLPGGAGEVVCDPDTFVCRVTVLWDDARALSGGKTCREMPDPCHRITVSTRL